MNWINLLLVFSCALSVFGALYRGDLCTQNDGRSGRCELIYDCQSGMKDLENKLKPKICGFDDVTPIVCCDDSFVRKETAMLKCFEYGMYKFSMDLRFRPKIDEIHVDEIVESNETIKSNETFEKNETDESNKIVENNKTDESNKAFENNKADGSNKMIETRRRRRELMFPFDITTDDYTHSIGAEIGGFPSLEREFPHMAALGYGNKTDIKWLCGGTLISEEYVLTAAHCLISGDHGEVKYVRLGDLNLYSTTDVAEPQDFIISKKIPHPAYKPPNKYHDIALLKLEKPVIFNDYIKPACLHTEHEINETSLISTGWGLTEPYGDPSDHLIKVDLELFTDDECKKTYRPGRTLTKGIITERMICAGGRTEEKGSCTGDSGGPLQSHSMNFGDLYTIYGITSFGKGCAIINAGGVYTRVSRYVPWIESIVWP